jgi:membrane protein YdbS with pleckstrin-like domain
MLNVLWLCVVIVNELWNFMRDPLFSIFVTIFFLVYHFILLIFCLPHFLYFLFRHVWPPTLHRLHEF